MLESILCTDTISWIRSKEFDDEIVACLRYPVHGEQCEIEKAFLVEFEDGLGVLPGEEVLPRKP
jgi:hypothetical protein